MPPLLAFAACLWAACACAYTISRYLTASVCIACTALTLLLAVIFGVRLRATGHLLFVVFLGVSVGISLGVIQGNRLVDDREAALRAPPSRYSFTVVSDGKKGTFSPTCIAQTTLADGRNILVRVMYDDTDDPVLYGDEFRAHASFSEPSETAQSYYWNEGIAVSTRISRMDPPEKPSPLAPFLSVRKRAISLFDDRLGQGTLFLRAILFGDRTDLAHDGFYQDVKVAGLAHVVAVSGAHLSVVCMLFGTVMSALRIPRKAIVIAQAAFIAAYLVFTGMPISGIRAAFMACIAFASLFARRRSASINALSLCVCVLIATSPETSVSLSFLLSAFSTFGIIVLSPLFKEWISTLLGGRSGVIVDSLALTMAAGITTVLLCASFFSQVSLISPLSNILAAPAFTVFCAGGLVVCGVALMIPALAQTLIDALSCIADAFCETVALLAAIPFAAIPASIPFPVALAFSLIIPAVIWVVWPKMSRQVVFATCILPCMIIVTALAFLPKLHGDEIIMLDVGQGDAFVIRSGNEALLIDTGNQPDELLSALARHHISDLSAVVITHSDDDHCGALASLKGVVGVSMIGVSTDALTCSCTSCKNMVADAQTLVAEQGMASLDVADTIHIGSFTLDILWPYAYTDEGGNADSLVLSVSIDQDGDATADWSTLFCGDAERNELDALIRAGKINAVDILKVGHHGSKNAFDDTILTTLNPSVALISAGANNRYGHPSDTITSLLDAHNIKTYRTDTMGDVVCEFAGDRMIMHTLD